MPRKLKTPLLRGLLFIGADDRILIFIYNKCFLVLFDTT